jgi:hypothetical protein
MKKSLFATTCLLGLASLSIFTGCVERTVYVRGPRPAVVQEPGEVVVTEAPPPLQQEVVVAAPGPNYFWVPGYWAWHGHWVWVGGNWTLRPHPHAVWVNGRWGRRGHAYVWIGGRWR